MDLHLPSMTTECFVTGNAFVEDERVVSRLLRQEDDGEVVRIDVQTAEEENLELPAGADQALALHHQSEELHQATIIFRKLVLRISQRKK